MITCGQAMAVLRGLERNQLGAQAHEIDEILKCGLAVEADPDAYHTLARILSMPPALGALQHEPLRDDYLRAALRDVEARLKDGWHRFQSSKEKIQEEEKLRQHLRYCIGQVNDPAMLPRLHALLKQREVLTEGTKYVVCPSLGSELYAITERGGRVLRQLELRISRFEAVPFSVFLKSFDKTYAKMDSFVRKIKTLAQGLPVSQRKHQGSSVVGLVKSGLPVPEALDAYHEAYGRSPTAEAAMACTRNKTKYDQPEQALQALRRAHHALLQAGLLHSPTLEGAAKSLLAFDPPEAGVGRFVELVRAFYQLFPPPADTYKLAGRALSAAGSVAEVARRAQVAAHDVAAHPRRDPALDVAKIAVALASMVKTEDVLPGLVTRFYELQRALLPNEASGDASRAADYALECVVCPGTPGEVVSLVRSLLRRIQEQGTLGKMHDHMCIAASFAKRFAY